jgi:antitoxin (DNA-binding transcriptional repressor) of toxin-antitoxin stability system
MYSLYGYIKFGEAEMQIVSATDLARNTREILDKVVSRGDTISIERNNTMIAQIVPPARIMTAAQALSDLALPTLTTKQAAAWLKDSKAGFSNEVRDPWE